jgi:hypothetical protein
MLYSSIHYIIPHLETFSHKKSEKSDLFCGVGQAKSISHLTFWLLYIRTPYETKSI